MLCGRSLAAYSLRKMYVLRHNRHALGVDGAEVCVFEQTDEVGLCGLLQGRNGRRLEANVVDELLRDLSHQPLEGSLRERTHAEKSRP